MAKAKMVAPYEQFVGRDSLRSTPNGSVVFQRTGAPVTRSFTRPLQPNTPIQHTIRWLFSLASIAYNGLSSSDVLSWHNLGLTITRTNSTGFTYHPSAKSLFVENFMVSTRNAIPPLNTAPASVTFNPLLPADSLTWTPGISGLGLTFPSVAFNQYVILYITNALSAGVRSLKGRSFHNPSISPVDPLSAPVVWVYLAASSTNIFFNDAYLRDVLTIGTKYGVRLQTVDPAANILGPFYDSLLVCT